MDIPLQRAKKRLSSLAQADSPRATFIVGAGISIPSGLPPWSSFAIGVAEALAHAHASSAELTKVSVGMRPEVMFQALYRVLGTRGIDVIRSMDPHRIRQRGTPCEPNALHLFLAKMIRMGHVVVTTNFDDLIEEAMEWSCPVASTQSEIAEVIPAIQRDSFAGLIKLHGTFRKRDGTESEDSIGAMLQEVQRAIPNHTTRILDLLLGERPVVVFGHSGLDDFDLYQRLSAVSTRPSQYTLWIMHVPSSEYEWRGYEEGDIEDEIDSIREMPRDSEYYRQANPLRVVQARHGTLARVHTREFLERALPDDVDWTIRTSADDVGPVVQESVRSWAEHLSSEEKQAAIASVFEAGESRFLAIARKETERLYASAATETDKARRDLSIGRIIYKVGNPADFDQAESLLRSSARFFSQQGLASLAGEAHLQLALLLSRRAITEETTRAMISEATKAVGLFSTLSQSERGYLFELGTALRVYALSLHRSLPDLDAVTSQEERDRCETLLRLAREYADTSLFAIDLAGNYLGERGQAQSLNVLGLIDLKLGNPDSLAAAKVEFERVVDLTRRSGRGFEREEFQGHRNLGLVLRRLAHAGPLENRDDLFGEALGEFRQAEEKANASDLFNIRFNMILLEVESESEKGDWDSLLSRLNELEPSVPKNREGTTSWHWAAWMNSTAAKVALLAQRPDEALHRVGVVTETYEQIPIDQIENQTYGVQNGRTNLLTCLEVLDSVPHPPAMKERLQAQIGRLSTLAQRVPELQVDDPRPDPRDLIRNVCWS